MSRIFRLEPTSRLFALTCVFGLVWLCLVFVGAKTTTHSRQLKHLRTIPLDVQGRFDPSGLVRAPDGKGLLTISDKLQRLQIFRIPLPKAQSKGVKLAPWALGKKKLRPMPSPHWKHFRLLLDLEGVAYCQGHVWVIAEQRRELFRIHPKTGQTTRHPVAFAAYERKTSLRHRPMARFSINHNAGFEGLTCDAKAKRLYLIQERQPRMVLVASLPTSFRDGAALSLLDHFDLPTAAFPKKLGRIVVPPDFAGADFSGKHLYLLFRNARLVLKVDPTRHALLDARSYGHVEKGLYATNKPFGMAEGLALSSQRLWIVFDNNGKPRKNAQDRRPVLVEFARPKGF